MSETALVDRPAYLTAFPQREPDTIGDFDGSGALDAFDVDEFEQALAAAGTGTNVPEPSVLALWGIAAAMVMGQHRVMGRWLRRADGRSTSGGGGGVGMLALPTG